MSFNVTITTSILFKEATAESAPADDHDTEADPVEDEDIDNVEADKTLSCDSSWVMARMASVSCCSSACLVS